MLYLLLRIFFFYLLFRFFLNLARFLLDASHQKKYAHRTRQERTPPESWPHQEETAPIIDAEYEDIE